MAESLCRNGSSDKATPTASDLLRAGAMPSPGPEILVICEPEVILHGVIGLLTSAGYAARGVADSWSARKLLESRRFDLAIIWSTDPATHQLLTHLERCTPAVPALVLNAGARAPSLREGATLLSAVAKLVGSPEPTGGSPGPTAA